MEAGSGRWRLTGYDVGALVAAGVGALWATAVSLSVAPAFARMFQDFGSALPAMTVLMLRPVTHAVLCLVLLGLGAAGMLANASPGARLTLALTSWGLLLAWVVGFFVGVYLPIFTLASAIK